MPTTYLFRVPLVAKLEKEAMATSIGMQWRHGPTILTKCKLLKIILDQLMNYNVIKDHYTHLAAHKLDQNNVEKLKFDQKSNSSIITHIIGNFG